MNARERYYENEIISITSDIEMAENMTEKEMQEYFNTDDSKEDFIAFLMQEKQDVEKHLMDEGENEWQTVDAGFSSEDDYLRYKFG